MCCIFLESTHLVIESVNNDKKLVLQVNAKNGKFINAKCANGKLLTDAHLAELKNIEEEKRNF